MTKRVVPALTAALASLLGTATAMAQAEPATAGEFTIQRFSPAPGPRNFITVEGARTSGTMAWSAALFGNYAHEPFVVTRCASGTGECEAGALQREDLVVVGSMVTADLLASLTVVPRLQLGMRIPFTYVHGPGVETDMASPKAGTSLRDGMKGSGLGDAMVEAKARLYGEIHEPLVIGAALFGTAPLGHATAEGKYIGDAGPTVGLRGIYDGSAGPFSFGANLTGIYRKSSRFGSANLGPELRYGLAAGYQISPVLRVVAEGFGGTKLSAAKGTNSMEALLAVQITPLASGLALTAGGGAGVMKGVGVPTFRGFFGVGYTSETVDTDGDGIPDDQDLCPTEPEDFDGFQDEDGCPDPDNDGDGILDGDDACPNVPGDPNPDPTKHGCPAVIEDRDQDGIPDAEDQCPDAGGPYVIRTRGPHYGCPDRDQDGIPDHLDQCPDEPEDTDGFEDEDGCPDPDNDGDGIPDYLDQCPDEPENYNGFEDDDGCPDEGPSLVEVTKEEIKILQQINFANNSDRIVDKRSFEILDGVVAVLTHHQQFSKIEVAGHTDNVGNRARNTSLSQKRAEAVVRYLVDKGIAKERLSANGYGPDKPIADNKTKDGRAQNRRVAFQILETAERQPAPKPTPSGESDMLEMD